MSGTVRSGSTSTIALCLFPSSRALRKHAWNIGTVHAYRGEADAAVTWLERAYGQRDGSMISLKVNPLLRNLRSDARYKGLLRKMNMPE